MKRNLLAVAGCWLWFACAATAQLHPPVATFTPAGEEETSIAILPPSALVGAGELTHSAHCLDTNPRQGIIAFSWKPSERAAAQRIDVTMFRDGFETGRFDVSPSLAADTRTVSLQGPEPGIYYYWRVLNETPSGWAASAVERFEAPICPSDGPVFDRSGNGE